jgi:hypothetical protein
MASWVEAAKGKTDDRPERLCDGRHKVKVARIVFGKKNGEKFKSHSGDPQIMVIYEDDEGREASDMFTLSDKAMWRLAMVLARAEVPADLERMDKAGVKPAHFANPEFAERNLKGRVLYVEIETPEGSDYADVTPLPFTEWQVSVGDDETVDFPPTESDEDIPF